MGKARRLLAQLLIMARANIDAIFAGCNETTRRLNPAIFSPGHCASAPVVERDLPDALAQTAQAKARDSRKYFVRVVSYRRKLLDEDNLAEKFHVDALRYAGILPSDAPGRCRIITTQEKVATKEEERTEITVTCE